MSWILAIDFGTSNTTAAFADGGGTPQVLEPEGSRYLPSVVVVDAGGNLLTGKVARQQASLYPERTERVPKRALVSGDTVVLGDRPFKAAELAGAVLRKVYDEALRFHGGTPPDLVLLTHPARWGDPLTARLREAALEAGITGAAPLRLLSEPEAAAWFYAPPADGQVVAVFDLGGGTLDTAVLRASGGGFAIAGPPGGDPDLGGEDFDDALQGWLLGQARSRDEDAWEELTGPGRRPARDRARLREQVTLTREALSEHHAGEVVIDGYDEEFRVTRDELEELIAEALSRGVQEMRRTVTAASIAPQALTGLYLTGGSSRTPLVAKRLWAALGVQPQLRDDPKAVVALGALRAHLMERELQEAAERKAAARKAAEQESARKAAEREKARKAEERKKSRKAEEARRAAEAQAATKHAAAAKIERKPAETDPAVLKAEPVVGHAAVSARSHRGPIESAFIGLMDGVTETEITNLAWSPDGRYLATNGGTRYNDALIWDTLEGERVHRLTMPRQARSITWPVLAWSPDSRFLITSMPDKTLRVWDAASGKEIRAFSSGASAAYSITWSPDGMHLATSHKDGSVVIRDADSGRALRALPPVKKKFLEFPDRPVAWSPIGNFLVDSSSNGIRISDPMSGTVLHSVSTGSWSQLVWSPDGQLFAGLCPGAIGVWESLTGREIQAYTTFSLNQMKLNQTIAPKTLTWTQSGRTLAALLQSHQTQPYRPDEFGLWVVRDAKSGRDHGSKLTEGPWSPWQDVRPLYLGKFTSTITNIALAPGGNRYAILRERGVPEISKTWI